MGNGEAVINIVVVVVSGVVEQIGSRVGLCALQEGEMSYDWLPSEQAGRGVGWRSPASRLAVIRESAQRKICHEHALIHISKYRAR